MRCVRCGWARASPAAPAVRSWRGSGQEREDEVGIEDAVRLIGQEDVRKEKEEGVCSGAGRRGCERMLKKRLLMQVLRLWGRFVIPNLLGPSSPILRSPHLREGMYRSSPSQAKCAGSGWAGIATTTKSCGLCHRRKPRGLGSHEFLPRTRPATGGALQAVHRHHSPAHAALFPVSVLYHNTICPPGSWMIRYRRPSGLTAALRWQPTANTCSVYPSALSGPGAGHRVCTNSSSWRACDRPVAARPSSSTQGPLAQSRRIGGPVAQELGRRLYCHSGSHRSSSDGGIPGEEMDGKMDAR